MSDTLSHWLERVETLPVQPTAKTLREAVMSSYDGDPASLAKMLAEALTMLLDTRRTIKVSLMRWPRTEEMSAAIRRRLEDVS